MGSNSPEGIDELDASGCDALQRCAVPTPLHSSHTFTRIRAGSLYTCGLAGGLPLRCWILAPNPPAEVTFELEGSQSALDFAVGQAGYTGGNRVCGISAGGIPWCGDGTQPVQGGMSMTTLSASTSHACGLRPDGRVACWGRNDHLQLGRKLDNMAVDEMPDVILGQERD